MKLLLPNCLQTSSNEGEAEEDDDFDKIENPFLKSNRMLKSDIHKII